ncbi:MAG: type II secretion system protein [Chlamydiales bacterium]
MQKRKKRPLTLMEIMIVIFLIGLIGSVIGYNMKGSIDEGRFFKSEQAASQVREILLLEIASGADASDVIEKPGHYVERSKLTKNVNNIMKDGWGNLFTVTLKNNGDIKVTTNAVENYRKKRKVNSKGVVEKDHSDDEGVPENETAVHTP